MQQKLIYTCSIILLLIFISCEKDTEDNYTARTPVEQGKSSKKGVSFKYQFVDDVHQLGPAISWSYNWMPTQNEVYDAAMDAYEVDFCPMAWNGINEEALRDYVSRNPDCEYLLAFNEPNLTDQANMTPQEAADRWDDVKSIADELGLKIISPAMNYGTLANYTDPIVWLDEFFTLVPESDFHGIAVHCYMSSGGALMGYIDRFKKYNKPIWLTEFCAWSGNVTPESQQRYMTDAINYLEADPDIFRYAWFIPRAGGGEDAFPYMSLLNNTSNVELTELGKIFTQMSTQDKSIYYVEQQTIEAEHYSSISIVDGIESSTWVNGPKLRLTTESPSTSLELYNFFAGQWVEYQVEADRSKDFELEIRYASFIDSEISILVDGVIQATHTLPNTQEEFIWQTSTVPFHLEKGKHTIRILQNSGTFSLNWLRFK